MCIIINTYIAYLYFMFLIQKRGFKCNIYWKHLILPYSPSHLHGNYSIFCLFIHSFLYYSPQKKPQRVDRLHSTTCLSMNRSSKRLREGVNVSVKGVGCVPVPIVSMDGFRGTTKEKKEKKTHPQTLPFLFVWHGKWTRDL